ncbi:MAG: hypothetical protein K2H87_09520 [Duncaniella sp.]|nr:hypothetical protein [Duncaniella sp.]
MRMDNIPILLTAAVSTHGMKWAAFSDEEREAMYLSTLTYYLVNMPGYRFVFAENSDWDLIGFSAKLPASLAEKCKENVEFISVPHSLCDISRGKGYNEMIMMKEAVLRSKSISQAGAFFKVTGRYPVYNLARFVREATDTINKGYKLYCDIKDHPLYDHLGYGWSGHSFECRLFGCTNDFFLTEFAPKTDLCNDYEGRNLEDVLFEVVKQTKSPIKDRFKREPHLGGVAGHTVSSLAFSQNHDDIKSKFKRLVGNSFRIFAPWFKF